MGQHVIGHGRYRETYPQTPHAASALLAFSRNSAIGPELQTNVVAGGTQIPWGFVENGVPGVNVPVTPKSTGVFLITGSVTLASPDGPAAIAEVAVQINNVIHSNAQATVDAPPSSEAIPVVFTTQSALPIGVLANIQILVTAPGTLDGQIVIVPSSSNLSVQEVVVAS